MLIIQKKRKTQSLFILLAPPSARTAHTGSTISPLCRRVKYKIRRKQKRKGPGKHV